MRIFQTHYKDQRAVALESEAARFLFLPDTGANMASAYSKSIRKEYLVQRPDTAYRRQPFDGLKLVNPTPNFTQHPGGR